jgi:hypothetical protein
MERFEVTVRRAFDGGLVPGDRLEGSGGLGWEAGAIQQTELREFSGIDDDALRGGGGARQPARGGLVGWLSAGASAYVFEEQVPWWGAQLEDAFVGIVTAVAPISWNWPLNGSSAVARRSVTACAAPGSVSGAMAMARAVTTKERVGSRAVIAPWRAWAVGVRFGSQWMGTSEGLAKNVPVMRFDPSLIFAMRWSAAGLQSGKGRMST